MSLKQGIKHGKEHRQEYHGSQVIDPSCRPHGGCEWCNDNRHYGTNRRKEAMDWEEECYKYGEQYDTEDC